MLSFPTILAIESSCDETAAAVIADGQLITQVVSTQTIHAHYGGVVPELASRDHEKNMVPVVQQTLQKANVKMADVDAIAFTQGPGLLGALLTGASFAKGMALALDKPLIGVHHMKAHVLAHFIEEPRPTCPFLCLTVSGGHTQIVEVKSPLDMVVLGQTLDDAAGEAFDKVAKILGLPYPGGPLLDKEAAKGNPEAFSFPVSQVAGYDFSFSGLKTAALYFMQKQTAKDPNFIKNNLPDICASIQQNIVQTLVSKLEMAAKDQNIKQIAIAGGVAANSGLRKLIQQKGKENDWQVFIPAFEYCTDNAAMIAMAAHFEWQAGNFLNLDAVASPRLAF